MPVDSWIALATALGAGSIGTHLVSLLSDRIRGRLAAKQRAAMAAADCVERARIWEDRAWRTRLAAIKAGVDESVLPDLIDHDDND